LRQNKRYSNEYLITSDPFTKNTHVSWSKIGLPTKEYKSYYTKELKLEPAIRQFEYCPHAINLLGGPGGAYFSFYIENISGSDYIVFEFGFPTIKLKKKDIVLFLLEDETILKFEFTENATKKDDIKRRHYKYREITLPLYHEEIKALSQHKVEKIRITQSADNYTLDINLKETAAIRNHIYCHTGLDRWYSSKNDIQYVIKQLFIDHFRITSTQIENYSPLLKSEVIETDVGQKITGKCFVYLMVDTTNNYYKIGISKNPKYREKTLQSEKPTIELIWSKKFANRKMAKSIEGALHNTFENEHVRGEWFKLSPKDIEDIKESF
jgi:hypothetical protein